MTKLGRIWMALSVAVVVLVSLIYVTGGIQRLTADFRGGTEKKERVVGDGDYRIASYDHFYALCSSILTKQQNIENLREELKRTDDANDEDQLQSAILAHENVLNEEVNEYNADAAANGTKGQYRASELPYHIDADEEVSCGSAS